MHHVPGIFGEDKHTSRSQNYTYIPTITVLESLQREGFQPFFACQTRVRDPGRRGYTKHMLRLRRAGEINGEHVPEIILLNSHDGTSSYQMLPGYFRFVCQNGCVCGQSLGEVRVPHRGNVVEKVIEGAYEVVGVFDRIEEKRDAMQSLVLPPPARQALAQAALTYRYGDEHQPVTTADILTPRRREDYGKDLWSAYQTIQENMLKGGISGRSARGKRIHTRAIHSIDTDIKLNRALWVMAEMTPGERSLIQRALKTLDRHLHEPGVAFTSTHAAREWLILNMAGLEREEFRVLYLNNQNQLIAGETLFTGTINRTEVHPREVIKRALYHNAAAVVLAHNHPSGEVTPSKADRLITERLVQALGLVDIRVPDHLIVGGSQVFSFAEHGLL
ncbi:TPA: DNA repair protein RadC [Escherichia coli]|nr:DNA repair protein RadC [Escherichia coli]HAO3578817.1 DNA repair protein RadC [Escherichia coli]